MVHVRKKNVVFIVPAVWNRVLLEEPPVARSLQTLSTI